MFRNKITTFKLLISFLLGISTALLVFSRAYADPVITGTSGTFTHGGTITISGSSFGTKSPATPLVWDNASGTNLLDKWDRALPSQAGSTYNIQYRSSPYRNVTAPHNHVGKMIVGGHTQSGYSPWNSLAGPNVMFGKNYPSGTENFYVSFYYRLDPLWPPNNGESVSDPNHKLAFFSGLTGCSLDTIEYLEYRPTPENLIAKYKYDYMGCSSGYEAPSATEPWDWIKIETLGMNINNDSTGKLYVWTNNVNQYQQENCDVYRYDEDSIKSICIGYYWTRCNTCNPVLGSNDAFRYFTDIYIDITSARVILANNQQYNNATIVEPQIPSAWSDNGTSASITATVNLGRLSGPTVYLFIFDSSNNHNSVGYPILIGGGGGGETVPIPPYLHP